MKTLTVEDLTDHYKSKIPAILEQLNLINIRGLEYLLNFNDSLVINLDKEQLRIISNDYNYLIYPKKY